MLRFNDATFLTFLASRQHAQPPPLKLAPFECHIRALPGYWREFGSRSRAEAALLPQWAALRTDARMRLSWSCEQPRPRIGDLEDLKAVPSAVHCVPDRYYSKHLRWTSDREPLKALDMEDRRLLGIW
ncbi:hypothetical protein MIND_01282100 [Mycena indigotica]|uniref:Uncharacterized protein n=1 Tax=Mycena indigotica TaxID=2126181 RepID=A0A8H6VTH5_9AGAR|nr:uncharacterized protein MIND_01282100 [Mycena indigotica]KAF7291376.1 hypothetical protein MIND_01282100 [Mycena indigotica]